MSDERSETTTDRCVALSLGRFDKDYGQSWCGRKEIYRQEEISLKEAMRTPERGGQILVNDLSQTIVVRQVPIEWCFTGASHVLLSARSQGPLNVCKACIDAMRKALETVSKAETVNPVERDEGMNPSRKTDRVETEGCDHRHLDFLVALYKLMEGHAIAREAWCDKCSTLPFIFLDRTRSQIIYRDSFAKDGVPWEPNGKDLLAVDWFSREPGAVIAG